MITRQQHSAMLMAVALVLSLYWPFSLFGASNETDSSSITSSLFDLLIEPDLQELTITTDLVEFIENRKLGEYQSATITYQGKNGVEVTMDVSLKARGKYRRRVCDFPPIKLKFRKRDLQVAGFNPEFNKLKMVTHCLDDKFDGNENVMKEYLMYKLYNELTPESYRVQLAKITYIDSKGKLNKVKRYGFIIESTDQMAFRLGGTECECMNPKPEELVTASENRVALFQYMIGNEDWNTMLNRNIKLVKPFYGGKMMIVPYDFDFAGAVDAAYAVPNKDLGLASVRDRFFQGDLADDPVIRANLEAFQRKRANFSEIILNFKPMLKSSRLVLLEYIDGFYLQIDQLSTQKTDNLHRQLRAVSEADQPVGSR